MYIIVEKSFFFKYLKGYRTLCTIRAVYNLNRCAFVEEHNNI